jgi:hypothetical protein
VIHPGDGGTATVATVLEEPRVLWVQPSHSTAVISPDPAVPDECEAVRGVRAGATCTFTEDVEGPVEIVGPGQTLDCAGHTITRVVDSAAVGIVLGVARPGGPQPTRPPGGRASTVDSRRSKVRTCACRASPAKESPSRPRNILADRANPAEEYYTLGRRAAVRALGYDRAELRGGRSGQAFSARRAGAVAAARPRG